MISLPLPNNINPTIDDWQAWLNEIEYGIKGQNTINFTHLEDDLPIGIKEGLIYINGSLYINADTETEIIPDNWDQMPIDVNQKVFIYASNSSGSLSFYYSNTVPVYSGALGGWYNGNDKAIFMGKKIADRFLIEKAILLNEKTIINSLGISSMFSGLNNCQLTNGNLSIKGGSIIEAVSGHLFTPETDYVINTATDNSKNYYGISIIYSSGDVNAKFIPLSSFDINRYCLIDSDGNKQLNYIYKRNSSNAMVLYGFYDPYMDKVLKYGEGTVVSFENISYT